MRHIKTYHQIKAYFYLTAFSLLALSACKKMYNLPDEKEYLNPSMSYSSQNLEPILGRTNLMGSFNSANSSLPLTFEIVNARYGDGRPVTDLFQTKSTYVWVDAYDGTETSLEAIEAKLKLEDHPLFEVRPSGQFIMWASATEDLVAPRPKDSSNLVQDIRFFDLKISNSGGETLIRDFQVRPWLERAYEPSTDINPYTGGPAPDPADPLNPAKQNYIRPALSNVIGVQSKRALVSTDQQKDVIAFIREVPGGTGNTIRVKVLDKDTIPINPSFFNETNWDLQVHGFNKTVTNEYVQYDVAYPIPLVDIPTKYTVNGNARFNLRYSRRDLGGSRTIASIGLEFKIFKKGDWEVVFQFINDNPKFEDE